MEKTSMSVDLFNGNTMPLIGLGTGNIQPEEADIAIATAVEAGYRHFDCAFLYRNERYIGEAIQKCINNGMVTRNELFITSKLPMIGNHPDRVELFLKMSLENLQLSYLDMYLIHFPIGFKYTEGTEDYYPKENGVILCDEFTDIVSIWRAMEKQVNSGRTKSIGLSNFNSNQITRIVHKSSIQPANVQVEVHAYFQQRYLHGVCQKHNIVMSAFAPLGSLGRKGTFVPSTGLNNMLTDPSVKEIADKHKKTPAQILLHFTVQQNISVIPKSSCPSRIKENFQIFDIILSPDEKHKLLSLDKGENGRSFCFAETFKGIENHPENPLAHP